MNMIIGVIIDVIVRSNDQETPENIALLEEINFKTEKLEEQLIALRATIESSNQDKR